MKNMVDPPCSSNWKETIPIGEEQRFKQHVHDVVQLQQSNADRMDGRPHRGFHVKLYSGLSAEFRVLEDIPGCAKHGVFKEPKVFPAWVRISNVASMITSDRVPTVVGFVVKLVGVPGSKLLGGEEQAPTQDFLSINQPFIPVRNADELVIISLASKNLLTAPLAIIRGLGLRSTLRLWRYGLNRLHWPRSLALESYWSNVPIQLGPYAVKFKWQPAQPAMRAGRFSFSRNYLRDELKRRLRHSDIKFDFMVQFYVDPKKTPIDGAFEWKPANAPFVKLAELVIRRRDLNSDQAKQEDRYVDSLAFNPWHALDAHRPLGDIQRARRVIYQAAARNWGHAQEPDGT
jgi:hypothetical protein